MATIKLSTTKVANRLISYVEKRAMEREGIDCPHEYAKSQMAATRALWGKRDGIQAHHVIQSFRPGEVTPSLANQIGQELALKIAKGYECVVYTHADKEHIHNHIVINSVSYNDGRKFHAHGKDAIEKFREVSDRLCKERGLSIVKEPYAQQRFARAEYGLAKRGQMSWKDEIREVIDHEKQHSKSYEDFKKNLLGKYNIEIKERGKIISFKHPDSQKFVRGKTLGLAYERGTLENGFDRQVERRTNERGSCDIPSGKLGGASRSEGAAEADNRFERPHEGLYQDEHGQSNNRETDLRQRNRQYQNDKQTGHDRNELDINEARKALERERRSVAKGFDRFTQRDETKQRSNTRKDGTDRDWSQKGNERDQELHADRDREHQQDFSEQVKRVGNKQPEVGYER